MTAIKVSIPTLRVPDKFESELQKDIYHLLVNEQISFERVENDPAVTMEDCKAIDQAFGVETIKTIFLTNRQKNKFYLLVMPADKPFVTKQFGACLEVPRVSFAETELLEKLLKTPRGAATPLSLIADKENKVTFIIDDTICKREKIVCTDGTLHGFISIKTKDLIDTFLPACKHSATVISL